MSPALVRDARKKKELALREQRPCTLTWGEDESVLAREGVAQQSQDLQGGGFTERLHCKFYVLRELLATAPDIGTVFGLEGREDEFWRLHKILAGKSTNDVTWIFECVEEDA